MKRILLIAALLWSASISFAQEPDSLSQAYDLQKTSRQIYKDYYSRLKHAVDSVLYHSGIDSLDCVVFDNVGIKADGTTVHEVKSNSANDKINRKIEEVLSSAKLPSVEICHEDGNVTPVDVTASFSIVSSARRSVRDFRFSVAGGAVQWLDPVPEILRGPLDKFSRIAFYYNDNGNYRLYLRSFDVNSDVLVLDDFTVYSVTRDSEDLFIRYSGDQFTYFGNPFKMTKEQLTELNRKFTEKVTKPLFKGKDANSFASWVSSKASYPMYARKEGITGVVETSFTIAVDGRATNVKIDAAVHPTLDREAFRTLSSSPDWTPACMDGKAVEISYSHPLVFKLRSGNRTKYVYHTPEYIMHLNWEMTTSR